MSKVFKALCFVSFLSISVLYAQQTIPADSTAYSAELDQERLRLAMSSLEYPVTLGDLYRLNYRQTGGTVISLDVRIDVAGVVSLGTFGKIDAKGMTFQVLKQKVEELISKNYSFSMPEFSLVSPGIFRVLIRDGSYQNRYSTVWGLSRLSEVVSVFSTNEISLRNVELISLSGVSTTYDLLSGSETGKSAPDPLLKPGDTIVLRPPRMLVSIRGEVRRPGTYELIGDEGLKELVEMFGGGLTNQADADRVRIDRYTDGSDLSLYLTLAEAYSAERQLINGDTVHVRARNQRLSLVWFEGAVMDPGAPADSALSGPADEVNSAGSNGTLLPATRPDSVFSEAGNGRFSYRIRDGQMLSDILQETRAYFHPLADLPSAILLSADSETASRAVDIPSLLSGSDFSTDAVMHPGDRVIIPSVSTTVTVSGAVYMPGALPYSPNLSASYYITLAGGADTWRNSFRSHTVYDKYGNKKKSSAPIQPGDLIKVNENDFGYFLERRIPIVTSIVGMVTTIITLTLLTTVP